MDLAYVIERMTSVQPQHASEMATALLAAEGQSHQERVSFLEQKLQWYSPRTEFSARMAVFVMELVSSSSKMVPT